MKCRCGAEATKTAVIDGKFGHYCVNCLQHSKRLTNPGHAQYSRDRDREDNLRDLIQPYDSNGQPNPDFIYNYPEESAKLFQKK